MAKFRWDEAERLVKRLSLIYDTARIVDPGQCKTLCAGEDGMLHEEQRCYAIWGKSARCRHCSSSYAMHRLENQEKDEVEGGRTCHVLSAPVEIEQADGSVRPCVIELVSSTERSEELRVVRDREVLQLLVAQAGDTRRGLLCFNIEDECIFANLEVFHIFRVPPGELQLLKEFFLSWVDDTRIGEGQEAALASDASWEQDCRVGDSTMHLEVGYHKLFDGSGRYSGYYYDILDQSLVQGFEAEGPAAAVGLDPLTNLATLEAFYQMARKALNYAIDPEYVLVSTNIKDFKFVNSLFGKAAGDDILISLARAFRHFVGSHGVVGRLHSDQFALLMPRSAFDIEAFAKVIDSVTSKFDSPSFKICLHAGIYEIDDTSLPISVMCDHANLAIATVKDVRETQFVRYRPELLEAALRETEILSSFSEALAKNEFAVYLQPQISVMGKLVGAETLVRWNHPKRGLLMPGQFIPLLENAGLIYQLDAYMWGAVAQLAASWNGTPMEKLTLSVNISARDSFYLDIYQTVMNCVKKAGISPKRLHLEITETALMSDRVRYNALIDRLRAEGFVVEIDDFGSGYSSLATLKDIHADVLKIDLGFLKPTQDSDRGVLILKSVIEMSKALNMPTITEGVERLDQVELLKKLGTDIFQGFYFDKPLPIPDFLEKYFDVRKTEKAD